MSGDENLPEPIDPPGWTSIKDPKDDAELRRFLLSPSLQALATRPRQSGDSIRIVIWKHGENAFKCGAFFPSEAGVGGEAWGRGGGVAVLRINETTGTPLKLADLQFDHELSLRPY